MHEKVSQALRDAIKVARECGDLESEAALHMIRAAMLMGAENEIYQAVKPIAEGLLRAEQSWPAEL